MSDTDSISIIDLPNNIYYTPPSLIPTQSDASPSLKYAHSFNTMRTIHVPVNVETGKITEEFELPILNSPPKSQYPPPPRFYHQEHPGSIDVKIAWSRERINARGIALVTYADERIEVGSRIYCCNMFGNGEIVHIIRRKGRYTHVLATFQNIRNDGPILHIPLAISVKDIKMTIAQRISAYFHLIFCPWVYYQVCEM
jgi:hypothetical protein